MQSCLSPICRCGLFVVLMLAADLGAKASEGEVERMRQVLQAATALGGEIDQMQEDAHHHHHHKHRHHHKHAGAKNKLSAEVSANATATVVAAADATANATDLKILNKMKAMEKQLAVAEASANASDSDSDDDAPVADDAPAAKPVALAADVPAAPAAAVAAQASTPCPPGADAGIDIDTDMPYGELEPFGREDTAQELTESSIQESDAMVDQLERAEVAEEKRSVFRALTRLRGAAITSFDGVARSQTGNIDEYNKVHKWRTTHPVRHLADEESDIAKWAFPETADML